MLLTSRLPSLERPELTSLTPALLLGMGAQGEEINYFIAAFKAMSMITVLFRNQFSHSTLIGPPTTGILLIVLLLYMLELTTLACEFILLCPFLGMKQLFHICSGTGSGEEGSKATGNAGARVACGVISLQQK